MALIEEHERYSAVWVKLKEHIEDRLDLHRKKNDADLSSDETARLRGRIAELKYLLDLDNPGPAMSANADNKSPFAE